MSNQPAQEDTEAEQERIKKDLAEYVAVGQLYFDQAGEHLQKEIQQIEERNHPKMATLEAGAAMERDRRLAVAQLEYDYNVQLARNRLEVASETIKADYDVSIRNISDDLILHVKQQHRNLESECTRAHDIKHIRRVVKTAKQLCRKEGGNMEVIVPAAWLHDCYITRKDSPLRSKASVLADNIHHCIAAHSFSAQIETETLEAKVVQDADRLDSLGAIGIMRATLCAASMPGVSMYSDTDTFCKERTPNDRLYSIDHYWCKLLKLSSTMKTVSGTEEAERRTEYMQGYLDQLQTEIGSGA
ncbi:Sds3-like protein [Kipferlia bialata]|uniref:Sds3-like protein n=1 Tax=Kipferlia bialata TaxID=797122 RepID=A0A9K3CP44_9EUKA|nr:Sds3-like protein [Kipferlia bialata]|eukprot:g504.t1